MSESIYEATSLLEAELAKFSPPPFARSEATASAVAAAGQSTLAIQAALAAELLSLNEAHEALIRHCMSLNDVKTSLA